MIRYLENEEKGRCEALWREAFPEDSDPFIDYYFSEKTRDNRILAVENGGEIAAMLHRNPYRLSIRGRIRSCDYLVGVATAVSERRRGHMRSLLLTAFRDMYEERMPFCFLMPARESIYRPYDFRFIFEQPRWVLKYRPGISKTPWEGGSMTETLAEDLAAWQNAWLDRQYEVYAVRDREYLLRMQRELESEGGGCRLIYDGDQFIGMESEWGLAERELRYLYTGDAYRDPVSKKPAIMARMICLAEFASSVRLSEACPQEAVAVSIGVNDLFLPQNQGEWLWELTKTGSRMTQTSRFISKGKVAVFSAAELTRWFFGCETPEQAADIPMGNYIEPVHGVFLDEVV